MQSLADLSTDDLQRVQLRATYAAEMLRMDDSAYTNGKRATILEKEREASEARELLRARGIEPIDTSSDEGEAILAQELEDF